MNIWKYPLLDTARQSIKMPSGSRILSVNNQQGKIVAWVIVDPEMNQTEVHQFAIVGTGRHVDHDILEQYDFIGTVQLRDGIDIAHVFERRQA